MRASPSPPYDVLSNPRETLCATYSTRNRLDTANAASIVRRCVSTRPRRIQTRPSTSSTVATTLRPAFTVGRKERSTREAPAPPLEEQVEQHRGVEQREVHERGAEHAARGGIGALAHEADAAPEEPCTERAGGGEVEGAEQPEHARQQRHHHEPDGVDHHPAACGLLAD